MINPSKHSLNLQLNLQQQKPGTNYRGSPKSQIKNHKSVFYVQLSTTLNPSPFTFHLFLNIFFNPFFIPHKFLNPGCCPSDW